MYIICWSNNFSKRLKISEHFVGSVFTGRFSQQLTKLIEAMRVVGKAEMMNTGPEISTFHYKYTIGAYKIGELPGN
jgi:hypothetical protein